MMGKVKEVDFLVIGGGIAGASVAANLSLNGTVTIFEAEEHPGYHSTGRSAALFSEIYGNQVIRALTRASRSFLFVPPSDFSPVPLVTPRETMYFATADQLGEIDAFRADADVAAGTVVLTGSQAREKIPAFQDGYLGGAALETGSADIDVDALHQGFLRQAKGRGAEFIADCRIEGIARINGRWQVSTRQGDFSAPVVVNAAGAWADDVAKNAGIASIGLQAKRRTAALIDAPGGLDSTQWPCAIAIDEQFYFKPDAGQLLISPADETDTPPCDAQPEELDVAIAVDRFEQATGAQVRKVSHSWAGLRVFAPDRTPIVGFDPGTAGFFWLAGQGGYGIQTSAALGRVASSLIVSGALPSDIADMNVQTSMLSPARFRRGV